MPTPTHLRHSYYHRMTSLPDEDDCNARTLMTLFFIVFVSV